MIVASAVLFAVLLLDIAEFFKRRVGRAINSADQSLLGCFFPCYIGKNIIHRAARSNKFNDCHIVFNSSLVSVRSVAVTKPAFTARVI